MSWAQCAACGVTFSSVSAFDKHQMMGDGSFGSVVCRDPANCGLVLNRFDRWGWPPDARSQARVQKMRAEQADPG